MVIIVEPKDRSEGDLNERDSLAGDFSIYDCIGNQIVKGLELQYDRDNRRLIYVWLGENLKGRNIGSGSYLILANVKRLYVSNNLDEPAELTTTDLQFKKTIGIKY